MTRTRAFAFLFGSVLTLAPGSLDAQPATKPPGTQPQPPHEVAGVTVNAPRDPKVVSTYPTVGGSVPWGMVVLKIAFDQPMTADAWSYGRSDEGEVPNCLARPRLLQDQRTFVLLCSLPPNHTYAMSINAAPGFVSAAGRAAPPFVLKFSTSDASSTTALADALKQAGLTADDGPIMDWTGASGLSTEPPKPRTPPSGTAVPEGNGPVR